MIHTLVALGLASGAALFMFWRRSRHHETVSSDESLALVESLVWCDGDLSPNGRRVLLVEPAALAFRATGVSSKGASCFTTGGVMDEDTLRTRLPDDPVKEKVSWPLDPDAVARLREGFIPEAPEDLWCIVTLSHGDGERVFLLRSETGALKYVLDLAPHGVRWVWRGARDPLGVDIAQAVIDGYVLGNPCVVPAPRELGEDKLQLMTWGLQLLGRRCRAVEPYAPEARP